MINKNLLGVFSVVCLSGISFIAHNYPAQGLTDKSQRKSSFQHKTYQSVTRKTQPDPIIVQKSNNVANQSTIEQTQPLHLAKAVFSGKASWYGPGFHGRLTANGERYNQYALTAAHRSLPFGTKVRVTNMNNGRSVVVRINDRGPFIRGRVIDLSTAAANNLGMIHHGVVPVRVQVIR